MPIDNLMEDAATAEISRAQLWQWVHHGVRTDDGKRLTPWLVAQIGAQELDRIRRELGAERFDKGKFEKAYELFGSLVTAEQFPQFLTSIAYNEI